ncbi:unnamed protein product [Spirodela intermedia]|uniref:Purple acid phosphatase n=1 Tax=Spirodela intermedia TaxID=51605 RepID=A0A7I8ISC6_SPIIN|nr:unnamed protein product [Spirodela intermedia]CAA6660686.1 unnamed protein product [Spirodela intermedia]
MAPSPHYCRRPRWGASSTPLLSLVLAGIFLLGCSAPRASATSARRRGRSSPSPPAGAPPPNRYAITPHRRTSLSLSLSLSRYFSVQFSHFPALLLRPPGSPWQTSPPPSTTAPLLASTPAPPPVHLQTYTYILYTSGRIHDVVIGPLLPSTIYYYRCSNATKEFSLKTPPAQLPIKFAVVGDPGQTGWTKTTLDHVAASGYDSLWDSFGLLVEPLASQRPWMVTEGNHEIEWLPLIESFKAYNARWRMPYELSGSSSNLYYSFDAAGGAVHVIMLGSYTDFAVGTAQYSWLIGDLAKINRQTTPWVVALIHAPWYNTNYAHQNEGEPMRLAMEGLLYKARVDVVFAGHVHAYERFDRVNLKKQDKCGPVHITVGDGGNREGLASAYISPKPAISLFREASFGHGQFNVVNMTHAWWTWHRNSNDISVVGDGVWLTSLAATPGCSGV